MCSKLGAASRPGEGSFLKRRGTEREGKTVGPVKEI
jgi:hypothetical protein